MSRIRFDRSRSSVTNIGYHMIWCPKYRKKLLLGEIADDLKVLLEQKSYELGIVLEQYEIMPDHIHLFINGNTSISISKIVQQLKGFSSRKLRQKYPKLMTLPDLWTRSYYCETVGHISKETIRKYIKNQKLQTNADS